MANISDFPVGSRVRPSLNFHSRAWDDAVFTVVEIDAGSQWPVVVDTDGEAGLPLARFTPHELEIIDNA